MGNTPFSFVKGTCCIAARALTQERGERGGARGHPLYPVRGLVAPCIPAQNSEKHKPCFGRLALLTLEIK